MQVSLGLTKDEFADFYESMHQMTEEDLSVIKDIAKRAINKERKRSNEIMEKIMKQRKEVKQ